MLFMLDIVLLLAGILISVAFLTLIERKIMSYTQNRKGPNKVSIYGLFQPFSDALKLFSKSFILMKFMKFYFYLIAPLFGLAMMMMMWSFYSSWTLNYSWNLEMMLFFSMMGLISYFLFFCGFSSTSLYSMIGYIRSISQTISYEVCIIIFILWFVYLFSTITFNLFRFWENGMSSSIFLPIAFFMWMFLSLSESNRSPFDFSEGESEIVSGFNIEYFGGLFSMIFIFEYGMIIFMSYIGCIVFFSSLPLFVTPLIYSFIYIWSRSSFPRFRYDKLMEVSWTNLTPLIVATLLLLMELVGKTNY